MTETASWTVGRLLQWTTDYLRQHGAESPRLDAEVLLAHARGCQRIELYTCFDEVASEELRTQFRQLVKRRAAGMPVAYLVGHREFYSHSFQVTPDVLIPRPETEFVVIGLLDLAKAATAASVPLRIADVGTGSGVLAICAALHLPDAQVTALDISSPAIEIARQNARRHGVEDRMRFAVGDLFDALPADEHFDFIIANPPYIGEQERADLPRDVIQYEPATALFAGPDGLAVSERLIAAAAHRLVPGGWLLVEFNPGQIESLRQFVARDPEFETPQFIEDLSRRPRVMKVRRRTTP